MSVSVCISEFQSPIHKIGLLTVFHRIILKMQRSHWCTQEESPACQGAGFQCRYCPVPTRTQRCSGHEALCRLPAPCPLPCPSRGHGAQSGSGTPPSQEGQQLTPAPPSLASGQTLVAHGVDPEALVFTFFAQGRGSVLSPSQPLLQVCG